MKTSELLAAKSSFEDNTKWLPFNVHANDTAGIISAFSINGLLRMSEGAYVLQLALRVRRMQKKLCATIVSSLHWCMT